MGWGAFTVDDQRVGICREVNMLDFVILYRAVKLYYF